VKLSAPHATLLGARGADILLEFPGAEPARVGRDGERGGEPILLGPVASGLLFRCEKERTSSLT